MSTISLSSPHAHDHSSVNRIMLHVCLALIPATGFSFYLFGLPAIFLFVITVGSCLLMESACLRLLNQPQSKLFDGSALLTGWLLAFTLPPWAPWWIGVSGAFIAIVLGKQIFGGLGQNPFNPAMLARVALLISFPVPLTTWPMPGAGSDLSFVAALSITAGLQAIPDGMTGATALGMLKTELLTGADASALLSEHFDAFNALLGHSNGSLGETSALLILGGGVWLLLMRIISWHIPVAMLGTVAVLASLFNAFDNSQYGGPVYHLLSGGLMLGAFFIATDLVTSPSSPLGKLVFGAGCGLLVFVIRTWGSFPEGVGFAVLFMNAITPIIDIYCRPRVYGRRYNGSSLTASDSKPRNPS